MNIHEREFFIGLIRTGKVFVESHGIELEIKPLTIEQNFKCNQIFKKAYDKAYSEEFMTEDDVNIWMIDNHLWTAMDDRQTDIFNENIENLKVEIYNSRTDTKKVKKIRSNIRVTELQLSAHLNKKFVYYSNTCEGIASSEKLSWIIKNTTYLGKKLYDFEHISLEYVIDEFQSSFLSEKKLRELARNDPWRSIWVTRKNSKIRLFNNPKNCELTYNQKNLLIWSQMYDNIQESVDCPPKEVIEDDDMLDGWFIIQGKKREKEKLEQELDSQITNNKIKGSEEVFLIVNPEDKKQLERINNLNDPHSNMIKKQRMEVIKNSNDAIEHHKLPDQHLKLQSMANKQFKK